MNEEDYLKKKFQEIWTRLSKEGKEEQKKAILEIIKQVKEHEVMHPLGRSAKIGQRFISVVAESDQKIVFFVEDPKEKGKNKGKEKPIQCLNSNLDFAKKLWKNKKGFVYRFEIQSLKRSPQDIMDSILSEAEFSVLFKEVGPVKDDCLYLDSRHVLSDKDFAKSLAIFIQRAGKAYELKVTRIKQLKFKD